MSKKNWFIGSVCFVCIFSILLIIVSINEGALDMALSKMLVRLPENSRYTKKFFGQLTESCGETPIYLTGMLVFNGLAISLASISKSKASKIIIYIVFEVLSVLLGTYACHKVMEYISLYHIVGESPWSSLMGWPTFAIGLPVGIVLSVGIYFFVRWLSLPAKDVIRFSIMAICTIIFAQVLIHIVIKPFMSRIRYRTMWCLDDDFDLFTAWYQKGGNVLLDGYIKDDYKSFPSGHTAAAGTTYLFMLLPFYFDKFKSKTARILCCVIPVCFTGIVAFGRIFVGAHFLSDVLFGGTIVFACIMIGFFIESVISKKKIIIDPSKE